MGLIDLQTDLKSLKFGKDRFGGGNSGQPFIQNPIIDEPGKLTQSDNDFLLRGGIRAPLNAAEDVARLTKYLFNPKSPSGLLFTAKQNLLSRVSPKTEASKGFGYAGGGLNSGVYTPLSTLAQAGVGFLGAHLNKQGLDPTGLIPGLGINKYEDVIKEQNENNYEEKNRLVKLTNLIKDNNSLNTFNFTKGYNLNIGNSIIEYGGGPGLGSKLGIGKTRIEFADQRTGTQNAELKGSGFFSTLKDFGYYDYGVFKSVRPLLYKGASIFNGKTISSKYEDITGDNLLEDYSTTNDSPEIQNFQVSLTKPNSLYVTSSLNADLLNIGKQKTSGRDLYNEGKGSLVTPTDSPTYLTSLNSTITPLGKLFGENSSGYNYTPSLPTDSNISTKSGSLYVTSLLNADLLNIGKQKTSGRDLYNEGDGSLITPTNSSTYLTSLNSTITPLGKLFGENSSGYNYTPSLPTDSNSSTKSGSLYITSSLNADLLEIGKQKTTAGRDLYNEGKGSLVTPTDSPTYLTSLNQKYPKPSERLSSEYAIEQRVKLGDPGKKEGKYATDVGSKEDVLDKINASTIYSTTDSIGRNSVDYNDLIAFRIGIINPENPSETTYMNFRAYIDSFSDSYGSSWKPQKYMGRAEEFYKYGGFSRDISLSFTIVAQSQGEMHGMYQKLNYLASSLAPTYTKEGYMAGNLSKLTVGDYIYEQTGFISSITYDIPQESSWELSLTPSIGIAGVGGSRTAANPDELPFMINVTGLKFTPIHQFRPEIQPKFNNNKGGGVLKDEPKKGIGRRFITNELDFTPNWTNEFTNTP